MRIFHCGSGSTPRGPSLQKNDVVLVSYPRSGNTWVRAILAYLFYPEDRIRSLQSLNRLVPDIYFGIPRMVRYCQPRVIKTHQPFGFRHESSNNSLYHQNIYVVRHPFAVVSSFFHFQLNFWKYPETSLERFVQKFVNGTIEGNSSWQEHVLSWKAVEDERKILFLRYEDLLENQGREIGRIADFLGQNTSAERINMICKKTSRTSMIKLQKKGPLVEKGYDLVRKAGSTWPSENELTQTTKDIIWHRSKIAMELFGYSRTYKSE